MFFSSMMRIMEEL